MASSSSLAGKGKRHAVLEDSPAFCLRIFSREDLKDGKKELPPAAAREYGHQMADHIFLKVPNWKTLENRIENITSSLPYVVREGTGRVCQLLLTRPWRHGNFQL